MVVTRQPADLSLSKPAQAWKQAFFQIVLQEMSSGRSGSMIKWHWSRRPPDLLPPTGVPAERKMTDWEQGHLLNVSAICTWNSVPVLAALFWTVMGSTSRPQLPPAPAVRQMATWPQLQSNQIILSIVFAAFYFINRQLARHKETGFSLEIDCFQMSLILWSLVVEIWLLPQL